MRITSSDRGAAALLEVKGLGLRYPGRGWRSPGFQALTDISVEIAPGETLGLVGESGSGKTSLGRTVLGLAEPTVGTVLFEGRDVTHASKTLRRRLARDIQVVFQDPYTSLNPMLRVGDILAEPLLAVGIERVVAKERVAELLDQVRLPATVLTRLPREFSGGQRQRIAIARALAISPKLVVCDEPVSALDLATQRRVLDLFIEIQERTGVAYLFISHDLTVVRAVSHRVAVMYRGRIVEQGSAERVTSTPEDSYTKRLLMSVPIPDPVKQAQRRSDRLALSRAE